MTKSIMSTIRKFRQGQVAAEKQEFAFLAELKKEELKALPSAERDKRMFAIADKFCAEEDAKYAARNTEIESNTERVGTLEMVSSKGKTYLKEVVVSNGATYVKKFFKVDRSKYGWSEISRYTDGVVAKGGKVKSPIFTE